MIKILVDKMPMSDKECPFEIPSGDNTLPSVCHIKAGILSVRNVVFGTRNIYNCSLSEGEKCKIRKSVG
jgi:hypothetical protein